MPLRILHSIRSTNPEGGGPIEGLLQMSRVNQDLGHTVEVVSLDDPQAPWVRNCDLKVHALGPGFLSYGYSSRFEPWLRAHHHDYDVVIINGIWQYHSFGVWRALRDTQTPYFVFTHGMLDPWFKRRYPLKHLKKWFYWPWGDYRVLRDAAAVLFTSEQERRLARRSFWLYHCDEHVVSYGTGGPVGDANQQRLAFQTAFPEIRERRQLLFLGRVHPKKGGDLLLQAFAQLKAELGATTLSNWQLVFAGPNDHPYGRELQALAVDLGIADQVTWTGMLQGDLKWGAFRCADAFVLPSHQENFGIAVAEALACALPVLISKEVNIWREIATDGGGIVDSDDLAGTKRSLQRWMQMSREDQDAMRGLALRCFQQRFHIEQAAKALVHTMELYGALPKSVLHSTVPVASPDVRLVGQPASESTE